MFVSYVLFLFFSSIFKILQKSDKPSDWARSQGLFPLFSQTPCLGFCDLQGDFGEMFLTSY